MKVIRAFIRGFRSKLRVKMKEGFSEEGLLKPGLKATR